MQTTETTIPADAITEKAMDALMALHHRTVDALTGYVAMVDKAKPEFRHVAEQFHAMHARHAERLERFLDRAGYDPDPDGTWMGTVNAAVVTLRAVFDDIDADVMKNIRDGEAYVLKAFDTAIDAQVDAGIAAALHEMRDEVTTLLADTRGVDA